MDQLAAAQRRAIDTAAEMTAQGTPVRYIRSTFVPDSGKCMCLFAADGEDHDAGQDAEDDDHDQELDQGEAVVPPTGVEPGLEPGTEPVDHDVLPFVGVVVLMG